MRFRYEAFDNMGRPTTGELEATTREDAAMKVRHELLLVAMKIEEVSTEPMRTVLDHSKGESIMPWQEPEILDPVDPEAPAPVNEEKAEAREAKWTPKPGAWQDQLRGELENALEVIEYAEKVIGMSIGSSVKDGILRQILLDAMKAKKGA